MSRKRVAFSPAIGEDQSAPEGDELIAHFRVHFRVVLANSTASLTVEIQTHDGTMDEHGRADLYFISASTVVHIKP